MSSMISWCHDAGNCCHVLTEKIMGKFMGKYRNLWENVGKYPINGGFELGNRTHRIFQASRGPEAMSSGKNDDDPVEKCEAFDPKCEVTTIQ